MEIKKDYLSLGELIIKMRKEKGYSQRKFAQISGLSNTTISRIENSETLHPDIETLRLLAVHLDIDETRLIKMVDSSKIQEQTARHAKLNYFHRPIRKIQRYSSVFSQNPKPHESKQEALQPKKQELPELQKPKDNIAAKPAKKLTLKGMRLITLRLERNITQKELADALGIDKTLISQYEGEIIKPDYETIEKLAVYFGVTMEYLGGMTDLPVQAIVIPKETTTKESVPSEIKQTDLKPEYVTIANEMQNASIDPADVRAFIEIIKKSRGF